MISMLLIFISCNSQETATDYSETKTKESVTEVVEKKEPHRFGGWYCPDNFGFVPVDIQKLNEVPAIADRLPTQDEIRENKSLINVDTEKHPDARAMEMDLPRVARIYNDRNGMNELIIVIQAIIV
ncbi:MAG: hypothetical protein HKN67_01610, partial [Saprospiraceae bacterium]|nr:hypothetical protein [Saprospiraceae bacterium]